MYRNWTSLPVSLVLDEGLHEQKGQRILLKWRWVNRPSFTRLGRVEVSLARAAAENAFDFRGAYVRRTL